MKKLDDISKKTVFNVPDDYFDELPSKIQARVGELKVSSQPSVFYRYKYAFLVPALAVVVVAFVLFFQPQRKDAERILASIETEQLVAYLQETDITTEDLLENFEFNDEEIQQIESEVYKLDVTEEELNSLLDLDDI